MVYYSGVNIILSFLMEKHFITCLRFGLSNFKSILSLIRIFHRPFFDMSREMPERPPHGMVIMSDGSLLLGEDMTQTPMDPFTMMLANTVQQFLNKKKMEKEKKDAEKAKDKKPKGSNDEDSIDDSDLVNPDMGRGAAASSSQAQVEDPVEMSTEDEEEVQKHRSSKKKKNHRGKNGKKKQGSKR